MNFGANVLHTLEESCEYVPHMSRTLEIRYAYVGHASVCVGIRYVTLEISYE